jgi:hypothetical protein
MLTFFENEPFESAPEDGYYCYHHKDEIGTEIWFSIHEIEDSVQVRLLFSGQEIASFSEEFGAQASFQSDDTGNYLMVHFKIDKLAQSKLELRLKPRISIKWNTLGGEIF